MPDNQKQVIIDDSRLKIAFQILQYSTIGLIVVAGIMVIGAAIASYKTAKPDLFLSTVEKIFTALLPLLGTWVGTVLAFYFSKANFETAGESVRKTYREIQEDKLKTYYVEKEMRPYNEIEKVEIDTKASDQGLGINLEQEVACKLSRKYTRIPIFSKDKIIKYMIHGSFLYEFFSEIPSDPQSALNKGNATLKNFIEFKKGKYGKVVEKSLAFVSRLATLATAKEKMEQQGKLTGEPCQDVFVTETGESNEPVLGWLSDKRIERYSKLQ
jgi:hypothetical protein